MEKKYVKTGITVAVIAVVIIAAFVVAINLNGGSTDFSNREVRVVITDSMDHDSHDGIVKTDIDSIPVNSMIMIHKLDDSGRADLQVGDVIAFWQGSTLYTHRIVFISTDGQTVTTRGDNTSSVDMPISLSDVYGKVVGVNTPLGIVVEAIRTNPLICIMIVVMAFIAVGALEFIVKDIREERKAKAANDSAPTQPSSTDGAETPTAKAPTDVETPTEAPIEAETPNDVETPTVTESDSDQNHRA